MEKPSQPPVSESEQISQNNLIGGRVIQSTDASLSKQTVTGTTAAELKQSAGSQQNEIRVGKLQGRGLFAVIGVIVIAVVFLILKHAA